MAKLMSTRMSRCVEKNDGDTEHRDQQILSSYQQVR
jgi:hypothetical protein